MPKWEFVDGFTREKISFIDSRWTSALEIALKSKATPTQSGYFVNAGGITKNGNVSFGGNHEMGITDTSTHGEEAVISYALDQYGKEDPIQIIAYAGLEDGGLVVGSCGNCRDIIKEYTDLENLVIINGPRVGGRASVIPGKSFFKENFRKLEGNNMGFIKYSNGVIQALKAEKHSYDIYLTKSSPKIYGASIVCENGEVFRGGFRGGVSYHPVLPLSSAIENFRNSSDDPERKNVVSIIFASEKGVPNVLYKDRQDGMEFAQAIQSINKKSEVPITVYLVDAKNKEVYKTNTEEWLPYAFSPKNLGLEKETAKGYEKLFKN